MAKAPPVVLIGDAIAAVISAVMETHRARLPAKPFEQQFMEFEVDLRNVDKARMVEGWARELLDGSLNSSIQLTDMLYTKGPNPHRVVVPVMMTGTPAKTMVAAAIRRFVREWFAVPMNPPLHHHGR